MSTGPLHTYPFGHSVCINEEKYPKVLTQLIHKGTHRAEWLIDRIRTSHIRHLTGGASPIVYTRKYSHNFSSRNEQLYKFVVTNPYIFRQATLLEK